jgi:hypothetical protein
MEKGTAVASGREPEPQILPFLARIKRFLRGFSARKPFRKNHSYPLFSMLFHGNVKIPVIFLSILALPDGNRHFRPYEIRIGRE